MNRKGNGYIASSCFIVVPNDKGIMSDLAMATALSGDPGKIFQAVEIDFGLKTV